VGRQRYLLSAAAVGALVVLLAYGFGVRGLGLNYGLKSAYTVVAAVLLVLSRRLVRGLESSDRPRVVWLAVAFVGGAAIACAASLLADPPPSLHRFETHKLPGFRIDLPTGKQRPMTQTYSTGMVGVELDEAAVVFVSWMPRTGGRDELEQMAERLKAGFTTLVSGSRIVTMADRDSVVLDFKDGRRLLYTTLACDARVVSVETIGIGEAGHARIVRSFACAPEPHAPEGVPVTLDTTGLELLANKDGQVAYASTGKQYLAAAAMPTVADAEVFRVSVESMLANQGLADVRLQPQGADLFTFTATVRGVTGTGTVRNVRCGARSVLVLGFASDPAAAPALAQRVNGARCK